MDFKTCWWRNVTNLLKTFEDMMTTNKFTYLFGFPSATAMSAKQHLAYYRTPDDHLRAIGKWASNVISHGVSTTIDHKVRQNKAEAKYSYQLMLMQHFTTDKVITDARPYWMPPQHDPTVESLENDGEEDGDE
jgi:hypothetical protein